MSGFAIERVAAWATAEQIVARAAKQLVVTRFAIERIVAALASEPVIAGLAAQNIAAGAAGQTIALAIAGKLQSSGSKRRQPAGAEPWQRSLTQTGGVSNPDSIRPIASVNIVQSSLNCGKLVAHPQRPQAGFALDLF